MANKIWPTAVAGKADSVSSMSVSACHTGESNSVSLRYSYHVSSNLNYRVHRSWVAYLGIEKLPCRCKVHCCLCSVSNKNNGKNSYHPFVHDICGRVPTTQSPQGNTVFVSPSLKTECKDIFLFTLGTKSTFCKNIRKQS